MLSSDVRKTRHADGGGISSFAASWPRSPQFLGMTPLLHHALGASPVPIAKQLRNLPLEARDATFEFVDTLTQRVHFAIDKLTSAVAHALVDLRRGLLECFPRESIV